MQTRQHRTALCGPASVWLCIIVVMLAICATPYANAQNSQPSFTFRTRSYIFPFPQTDQYQLHVLGDYLAAGLANGLEEAFSRKPRVRDFEYLPTDILSIKGFWKNKVTRVLMVVVFTNLGSAVGTFVAIPLMAKVL